MAELRNYLPEIAGAGAALALAGTFAYLHYKRRPPRIPRVRKGVFIERSLYDNPSFVLRDIGIEWVIVETSIQSLKRDQSKWITRTRADIEKLYDRINPPGSPYTIEMWAWGWPIPEFATEFAAHAVDILASSKVAGYVLDIEAKSWSTKENSQFQMDLAAHSLIAAIRNNSNKKLMLSSHGRADYAPLPWNALRRLDGALPQAYDAKNKYGEGFIKRCIDSYKRMGFTFVSPTLGATKYTSPARMVEMLADMPPVSAVNWWTWTSIGANKERQAVIRNFSLAGEQLVKQVAA